MKKCCPNCGYSDRRDDPDYCCRCGHKMVLPSSSQDVCPSEKQDAFIAYIEARQKFVKPGGKLP